MDIDYSELSKGMAAAMKKEANVMGALNAGFHGMQTGMNNTGFSLMPIKYLWNGAKGFAHGIAGYEQQNETQGLRNMGVSFNQDPYGRIHGIDYGQTTKGILQNAWTQLRTRVPQLFNQFNSNPLGFTQQHPWMTGLAGAGTLGGLYGLYRLFSGGNNQPQMAAPTYYPPTAYSVPAFGNGPQALQKTSGLLGSNFLPTPLGLPLMAANLISDGGELHSEDQHKKQQLRDHILRLMQS